MSHKNGVRLNSGAQVGWTGTKQVICITEKHTYLELNINDNEDSGRRASLWYSGRGQV